jgi:uncharacterized LabA/DUF88 family protein
MTLIEPNKIRSSTLALQKSETPKPPPTQPKILPEKHVEIKKSITERNSLPKQPIRKPIAMVKKPELPKTSYNNFAFIDCQNLWYNLDKDWQLDWNKFFNFLKTKHNVKRGYVFIGFVAGYQKMYQQLQEAGFILIFKPVQETSNGIKCNVDTEMVLQTMIQLPNYDRAVIVSGDGDFTCLVDYLSSVNKLESIMIPGTKSYSHSLEKAGKNRVVFISKLKNALQKDASTLDDMPMIISE